MSSEAATENLAEQQTEGMDLSMNNHTESKMDTTTEPTDDKSDKSAAPSPVALPAKKKRKKSKKIKRSAEYPKFYRNAYVRYCDEMRPKVCEENPALDSVEITKLVASKWYALPKEDKQPYLDDAKVDKDRFESELKAYKTLNPDECLEEKQPAKKQKVSNKKESKETKNKETPTTNHVNHETPDPVKPSTSSAAIPTPSTSFSMPSTSSFSHVPARQSTSQNNMKVDEDILKVLIGQNCEVPIFTDTFLEHNKIIESELKILRKNNVEIEQQNSVLMKHIENMQNGVSKVELEIAENRKRNMQLEVYLTKLRVILSANFNSLQIPGWKGGATVENVDKYITDLAKASSNSTLNKARDIIKKIDLQI
ncbi:high mobility group protein 20A [Chironomus tepperi]|uniref:high mobility group protein 20A n=1 Tax=Chironomus tepperi TaxID=113505 RepID=UPI00391FAD7A